MIRRSCEYCSASDEPPPTMPAARTCWLPGRAERRQRGRSRGAYQRTPRLSINSSRATKLIRQARSFTPASVANSARRAATRSWAAIAGTARKRDQRRWELNAVPHSARADAVAGCTSRAAKRAATTAARLRWQAPVMQTPAQTLCYAHTLGTLPHWTNRWRHTT